ncbi:MAG TPA: HAD-IA family hydrolase [Acidobacteriaceae bacterium]|nr:HAD-IA family hydrolase [Acidobacteriaceae bacterium]
MADVVVQAKGLLFDMDGVLVSSIASADRCWRRWAQHYGVPNADSFRIPHGVRAADIVRMTRPDIDVAEGLRLIEDMEIEDVGDVVTLPGARALLESLPLERWAIVTSANHRLLLARLQAAGLPVPQRLVSAEMVEKGKPDPEPYRRGAEMVGVPASECVVVEDAPSGVRAGKAAGCRVLGVLGTHSSNELRTAGAEWVVPSLEAVSATVAGETLALAISELDQHVDQN